jgi:hypothetical protein
MNDEPGWLPLDLCGEIAEACACARDEAGVSESFLQESPGVWLGLDDAGAWSRLVPSERNDVAD